MYHEQGGSEPNFSITELQAMHVAAQVLQLLKHGPLEISEHAGPDRPRRTGSYLRYLVDEEDRPLQVDATVQLSGGRTRWPDTLALPYGAEDDLPARYSRLPVVYRGNVDVVDLNQSGTLGEHILMEIVEPGSPLDGGVVVLHQEQAIIEDFDTGIEPYDDLRVEGGFDELSDEASMLKNLGIITGDDVPATAAGRQYEERSQPRILSADETEELKNLLIAAELWGSENAEDLYGEA